MVIEPVWITIIGSQPNQPGNRQELDKTTKRGNTPRILAKQNLEELRRGAAQAPRGSTKVDEVSAASPESPLVREITTSQGPRGLI